MNMIRKNTKILPIVLCSAFLQANQTPMLNQNIPNNADFLRQDVSNFGKTNVVNVEQEPLNLFNEEDNKKQNSNEMRQLQSQQNKISNNVDYNKAIITDYKREVMFNFIVSRANNAKFNSIKGDKTLEIKDIEAITPKTESSKPKEKLANIKGYCFTETDVNVGFQPMGASLKCNTNYGTMTFFGNYVPNNELYTLFITGLFVEKGDFKYPIVSGKILNKDKNSYNIATYVNSNKIEKAWLQAGANTADVVKAGANDYMKQLEQSRKKETGGATTVSSSGAISQEPTITNYEKPNLTEYIIKGGVDVVTTVAKEITQALKEELPFAYKVVKDTQFYIDIWVKTTPMESDTTLDNEFDNKPTTDGSINTKNQNLLDLKKEEQIQETLIKQGDFLQKEIR
ncbi:hypothetical protein [Campylobacter sp. RM12651]|uniref:hypothetical protein n=1 Tax=Campylobacter sp. RM12651 TaxID=1660079 RepID=UPI001EFC25F9|nr:hypothetical protein [Campylobacter sp. RM12651]